MRVTAPALTIAAQAFLLRVLTDGSVDVAARAVILAAGVLASVAAAASLLRLRWREVQYSEEIRRWFVDQGLPSPVLKPSAEVSEISDKPPTEQTSSNQPKRLSERWLREWAGGWRMPVYLLWCLALIAFVVADIVPLIATA